MSHLKKRLEYLERRPVSKWVVHRSPLACEIQDLDQHLRGLEADIAKLDATMSPEERSRGEAELEEFLQSLEGLSLDEKIAALEIEIERLETSEGVGGE
jgi:uncharacterized small protein (DUF1192 family)